MIIFVDGEYIEVPEEDVIQLQREWNERMFAEIDEMIKEVQIDKYLVRWTST